MEKSINVKIYMSTISLSKKAMCIMIYSCEIDEEEQIEKQMDEETAHQMKGRPDRHWIDGQTVQLMYEEQMHRWIAQKIK